MIDCHASDCEVFDRFVDLGNRPSRIILDLKCQMDHSHAIRSVIEGE